MDTKSRQVNIRIWDHPHFTRLDGSDKLFWWFINCMCDNAGIYEHNPKLVNFHCDAQISLDSFIKSVNRDKERVRKLDESTIWIRDFVRDTWGTITGNNVGLSCYRSLVKHDLQDVFYNEYPSCINVQKLSDHLENKNISLSLPKGKPTPDQPLTNGKPDPINLTITSGVDFSIIQSLKDKIPNRAFKDVNDISVDADLMLLLEQLKEDEVKDPVKYLSDLVSNTNWKETTWSDFMESFEGKKKPHFS